jgi:hypothetical protein
MEKKMSGDDPTPTRGADQKIHPTDTASLAQRHSTHHKEAGENKPAEPGELLTGQRDPGLTLTGGGGHA